MRTCARLHVCTWVCKMRGHVRLLPRSSDLTKDQDVNLYENHTDNAKIPFAATKTSRIKSIIKPFC